MVRTTQSSAVSSEITDVISSDADRNEIGDLPIRVLVLGRRPPHRRPDQLRHAHTLCHNSLRLHKFKHELATHSCKNHSPCKAAGWYASFRVTVRRLATLGIRDVGRMCSSRTQLFHPRDEMSRGVSNSRSVVARFNAFLGLLNDVANIDRQRCWI